MIFVLGDSRTGTTSVHRWLVDQGLRSVHYFVPDVPLIEPLHRYRISNWPKLRSFLRESGYQAFSDYPVRAFFREIVEEFPDAYFILTVRRDLATWRGSMLRFFLGRSIDIELLQAFYVAWNEEIRALFAETGGHFLELCIDEDSTEAGSRLAGFLGFAEAPPLPHLNASIPARADATRFSSNVRPHLLAGE